ncbi:MAG: regulatory protein RecX [Bowdeniella nasicola]|nr:regulatory protein RecX [Bowdeniella nasicola]
MDGPREREGDDGQTEADDEMRARSIILRRLDRAPASRAQLVALAARKDIPAEIAARVLDRFEEVGLVDDSEYAAMLVRTRHRERQLAKRALRVELQRKGIREADIGPALAQVSEADELAAARAVVAKKLRQPSTANARREVQLRRLFGLLGRKGFSSQIAYRVVNEALQ